MASKIIWCLVAASAWPLAAFAQGSIPSDPLEIVTGPTRSLKAAAVRASALRLLSRARGSYALRTAGRAYDLKVSFKVMSGGQTEYDGVWQMEDTFDPREGFRWSASVSGGGYTITRISAGGVLYGEETGTYIPLRLQEARAALFDPMPSAVNASHGSVRTSTAFFRGTQLTCVLLSAPGQDAAGTVGRHWDETSECIDPQTGLLQVHSQAPGRYYAYDYTDAPRLGDRILPRKVIVTEAGKTITEISVDRLTETTVDRSMFVPTDAMKAKGRPAGMAGAQKLWQAFGGGRLPTGAGTRTVCVFGVVTPTGELKEAHSLQPSDPSSQAAVEAVKKIAFADLAPLGAHPQQHFVFVFESFGSSQ